MNGKKPLSVHRELIKPGFVDKNLSAVFSFTKEFLCSRKYSDSKGLLQSIGPAAKVGGVFVLLAAAVFAEDTAEISAFALLPLFIALASGVSVLYLLKRVFPVTAFTAVVVAPVVLEFFMPGESVFSLSGVSVTEEGIRTWALIAGRVAVMAGLISLLMLTTRETEVFKGAAWLPSFFPTALFMTLRYTLLLLKTVEDMNLARKSRTIRPHLLDGRSWIAGVAAFVFERALRHSTEVTMAMKARGFSGRLRTSGTTPLKAGDYIWLGFSFFVFFIAFGI
jgi:cobalt/nickel transport system permease protein